MQGTKPYVLLALAGALLLSAGALRQPAALASSAPAAASGRVIAVTGFSRSGLETLYLVDTERMRLAAYEMKPGGLALVAVRKLDHDFRLVVYADASAKGVRVQDLIERARKQGKHGKSQ